MALDGVTKRVLRSNPELRQMFFEELKSQQKPKNIEVATDVAKKAVQSIEDQEARILDSGEYRQALGRTVKPEMRPSQPTEDLYEKGYMQEEAFWNDDRHNRVAYSYGQKANMKGILRHLCDGDGTRALIESKRAEARALNEVAPAEGLRINVPVPESSKAKTETGALSELKTLSTPAEELRYDATAKDKAAKELLDVYQYSKGLIRPQNDKMNEVLTKMSQQTQISKEYKGI